MTSAWPVALAASLSLVAGFALAAEPARGTVRQDRTLAGAATSPLEDANLKRIRVPAVLTAAVAHPYDLNGMDACSTLAVELARLDEALGPDLDQPISPDQRSRAERGGEAATGMVRAGVQSVIPFRGLVRQVTGAARYAKQLQDAVDAGAARRGFLKGVGMKMNCAPPAAPYGFRPPPPQKPRVVRTTTTKTTTTTTHTTPTKVGK